jgi:hypothetical protein
VGFLDLFRSRKTEEPAPQVDDSALGKLIWSEDEESWGVQVNGVQVMLAYEGAASPSSLLIEFARQRMRSTEWSNTVVLAAKQRAKTDKGARYHAEIDRLVLERVSFYQHRKLPNGVMVLLQFSGGDKDHFWSADLQNDELVGIGFDT